MEIDRVNLHFGRGAKALMQRGPAYMSMDAFQRACCLATEMLRAVMCGGFKSTREVNPCLVAKADPSRLIGCLPDWLFFDGENFQGLAQAFEEASRVVSLVNVFGEHYDFASVDVLFYHKGAKEAFCKMETRFSFRGGMNTFVITTTI